MCSALELLEYSCFEPRGERRILKNCTAGYSRELPLLMTCRSGHPNRRVDILPRVRAVVVFLLHRFEPRGEVQDEAIVRAGFFMS